MLQAATPLSAVFQFFLRDLSGMLGGVTFAFLQASLRQEHLQPRSVPCKFYMDLHNFCRAPSWMCMLSNGVCLLTA